jgi:hypothetical protein
MGADFTPGPWAWTGERVVAADGFVVASADGPHILPDYRERLGVSHWAQAPGRAYVERDEQEVEANARLIAAAPCLLAALEKAMRESGCDGDLCAHEWHDAARAALAKARGEATHG